VRTSLRVWGELGLLILGGVRSHWACYVGLSWVAFGCVRSIYLESRWVTLSWVVLGCVGIVREVVFKVLPARGFGSTTSEELWALWDTIG
jgi:hypothetical protein